MNYDAFKARHMIACFILGLNILPPVHGTARLAAIKACRNRGYRL
jgi:hypothetical protein